MNESGTSLEMLQEWLQSTLIFPGTASLNKIEEHLMPSARLKAAQRLGIYQRSYYLRLVQCMREQFPALRHALGDELFSDFAREYLKTNPSDSYTLYELGRRFPSYLELTRPDIGERESWVDFIIDMARFERQLFVMFDAPGHEANLRLADAKTPDRFLQLQPCFALGDYRFPVDRYYQQVRRNARPEVPPAARSRVAIVRKDYLTSILPLTAVHFAFLSLLQQGHSVAFALQTMAEQLQWPVGQVYKSWRAPDGIRKRWLDAGFFVGLDPVG